MYCLHCEGFLDPLTPIVDTTLCYVQDIQDLPSPGRATIEESEVQDLITTVHSKQRKPQSYLAADLESS